MVIAILIVIILLLISFIGWLFKELFIIVPKDSELAKGDTPKQVQEPKALNENSIVGLTRSVPLVATSPKPKVAHKAQLPPEEIEDAFLHVEFNAEYIEAVEEAVPEEESTDVIDTQEHIGVNENVEIDRRLCMDYEQISTSIRKIASGEQLNIEDAETLQKLESTGIDAKLKQLLPSYQAVVAERLSQFNY